MNTKSSDTTMSKAFPLVSCVTSTYGRYTKLRDAVSCFVDQDYPNKELLVLNNHSVPLTIDLPGVTVYNEPGHPTLGDCRNRLLSLAKGEFIRTFDDDDFYLPWSISQGMDNIGNHPSFKPSRSWFWLHAPGKRLILQDNVFEAAMLVRTEIARKYGYKSSGGDEHHPLLVGLREEPPYEKHVEFGVLTGYIYSWGYGHHISGSLGSATVEKRTHDWQTSNNDTCTEPMTKNDLTPLWQWMANGIKQDFTAEEHQSFLDKMKQHNFELKP